MAWWNSPLGKFRLCCYISPIVGVILIVVVTVSLVKWICFVVLFYRFDLLYESKVSHQDQDCPQWLVEIRPPFSLDKID